LGSCPQGGCGPNSGSTSIVGADRTAKAGFWTPCASWAGQAAGKIKTRAENVKAALNLSEHFIIRMVEA
jgi:hypothetical protein